MTTHSAWVLIARPSAITILANNVRWPFPLPCQAMIHRAPIPDTNNSSPVQNRPLATAPGSG